jgi:FkbM family methyltransferase
MSSAKQQATSAYRQAARLIRGYVLGQASERAAWRWFRDRGDETLRLNYPLDRNSVVLDCGGFEGDWAAAIHERYGSEVFVFEPVAAFLEQIRRRFEGNPKIHPVGYGLHSRNERCSIFLAGNASSTFGSDAQAESIELRDVAEALPALGIQRVALAKINIEGGEYELLDRLINSGLVERFDHLQVQFHRFVPGADERRSRIREALRRTHQLAYDYEFIWESWTRC